MRAKLTDLSLSKLPFTGKQYAVWDIDLPSFGVRVYRGKVFVLKQHNKYHALGKWPVVSLKQARDEAKRRLALKYFPRPSIHAEAAIPLFLEASSLRPTTRKLYERTLLNQFPEKHLNQVTLHDLTAVLRNLPKGHANLAHSIFSAFLNWAVQHEHVTRNPLTGIKKHRSTSRDRLLTDEEVRLIWQESYNHNSFGALLRLLLLTGQRLSQITHMERKFCRETLLVFPYQIMKNAQEHVIPLTPFVKEQLEFHASSIATHTTAAPSPIALSPSQVASLSSRNPAAAPNLASPNDTKYIWGDKPFSRPHEHFKKFRAALNIPHWTMHDFRRYLSSTMSRLNVPIDITEAILAHKTGSRSAIQRVYDRDTRIPQMRVAFTAYHGHLVEIGCNLTEPSRTNSTST